MLSLGLSGSRVLDFSGIRAFGLKGLVFRGCKVLGKQENLCFYSVQETVFPGISLSVEGIIIIALLT